MRAIRGQQQSQQAAAPIARAKTRTSTSGTKCKPAPTTTGTRTACYPPLDVDAGEVQADVDDYGHTFFKVNVLPPLGPSAFPKAKATISRD